MGILDKLFGGGQEYPPLEQTDPIAERLAAYEETLGLLCEEISDPLEVIPTEHAAYVFIGKPPKKFGFAWIEGDTVHNFKTLVDKRGMNPMSLQILSEQLRDAYTMSTAGTRFSAAVRGRPVVVNSSEPLQTQLDGIIEKVAH